MTKLNAQLRDSKHNYVTDIDLDILLDGSPDSRYGIVKRLLKQRRMLHIRRGLYYLNQSQDFLKPHPFELAQYIYAPSYISLESALGYHQLIPEAVYAVTSVCIKRSKEFHTPIGVFSYLHLPVENFYTEVELITENNYRFMMAKPWKAICDYIYCYKKNWDGLLPLIKSLRINRDDLPELREKEIALLENYYQHRRLSRFLKKIAKDLQS
jgi:predicted transcriptional regulator of viral defense system